MSTRRMGGDIWKKIVQNTDGGDKQIQRGVIREY